MTSVPPQVRRSARSPSATWRRSSSARSRSSSTGRSRTASTPAWDALSTPETVNAFKLTLIITAIAVPLNTIFGVACALAIVRRRFRGKGLVNAFVDLPLALSPVVVGLSLFLLYGRDGWFGWLGDHGIQVLFSLPAMVIATVFVSLPFVAREVVPDAARDRRRAGAGGAHARRERLADVLADHAAGDPLGGDLRRHPHDRALPRRVRRRRGRLRPAPGRDGDGDAARRGALRVASTSPAPTRSRSCSRSSPCSCSSP